MLEYIKDVELLEDTNFIKIIEDKLKILKHRVISITGGGGKTSLMFALGRYSAEKTFTLLTTTTKIFPPHDDESHFIVIAKPDELLKKFELMEPLPRMMTATKERSGEKLSGYTPEDIAEIISGNSVGRAIIEADGSRGLSLKAYEDWEPPVPSYTDCQFILMGADIFNETLSSANVFRFDIIKNKFSIQTGEYLSFVNCAAMLSNKDEYLKNSPESAFRILFINKCDLLTDEMLDEISEKLPPLLKGYDAMIMGSVKLDKIYKIKNLVR